MMVLTNDQACMLLRGLQIAIEQYNRDAEASTAAGPEHARVTEQLERQAFDADTLFEILGGDDSDPLSFTYRRSG